MKISIDEINKQARFISGVAASEVDVSEGRAAFSMNPGGTPINIILPQYAWHLDLETGAKSLWIVIQAEENNGVEIYGAVSPENGESFVGTAGEFELLGDSLQ